MGPYFRGQTPNAPCGCFYPDVTRIRDDVGTNTRLLYCVRHGQQTISLDNITPQPGACQPLSRTERETERLRLRTEIVAL